MLSEVFLFLFLRQTPVVKTLFLLPVAGSTEMVFCYQYCSTDRKKLLRFEAFSLEFVKFSRSFIQILKGHNNFW